MKAFKTSRTPSLCAKRKATLGNAQQTGSSNFLQRDAQFLPLYFAVVTSNFTVQFITFQMLKIKKKYAA